MKVRILITLIIAGLFCNANMSSPFREGTKSGTAFSSRDINILSEDIQIIIDKKFETAKFTIEYTIESEVAGKQIPLLFFAQDYKDSFIVSVNDKLVEIINVPDEYIDGDNSPFSKYSNVFINGYSKQYKKDQVVIYWERFSGVVCNLSDLKYFESDIAKGVHKIRVQYTAKVWTDLSEWVKQYTFTYSLTPAKYWKSFGTLHINVQQQGEVKQLFTNLGQPIEKTYFANNTWTFNKLPDNYLAMSYSPNISSLARALITITPLGLSMFVAIVLLAIHVFFVISYRKRNIGKQYSSVVIVGSLLLPFLILLSYMFSYDLIDYTIGEEAGRHHGYVFIAILLYPILLSAYWRIVWLIDRQQKRKLSSLTVNLPIF